MGDIAYFIKPRQKAELSALTTILVQTNPDYVRLLEALMPSDFVESEHQLIFDAMRTLFRENEPIDVITVSSWLDKYGMLENAGGRVYLLDLAMSVFNEENVSEIIRILKQS